MGGWHLVPWAKGEGLGGGAPGPGQKVLPRAEAEALEVGRGHRPLRPSVRLRARAPLTDPLPLHSSRVPETTLSRQAGPVDLFIEFE